MNKHNVLVECINDLKNVCRQLGEGEDIKLAVHCIEMGIIELSRVAEAKKIINERMMLDYMTEYEAN